MVYHKCCSICGRILVMANYEKGICDKCTEEQIAALPKKEELDGFN